MHGGNPGPYIKAWKMFCRARVMITLGVNYLEFWAINPKEAKKALFLVGCVEEHLPCSL
jgi:hypothetical protein